MNQTGPAVVFDPVAWQRAFPVFGGLSNEDAQAYFDTAQIYCDNSCFNPAFAITLWFGSPPVQGTLLQRLLWLLTCHLAWLGSYRDVNGNPTSGGIIPPWPVVGRVSSASEGSVSVSADLSADGYPVPGFFTQTQWGLQFWQATAQFRTMHYRPNWRPVAQGLFPTNPWLLGARGNGGAW